MHGGDACLLAEGQLLKGLQGSVGESTDARARNKTAFVGKMPVGRQGVEEEVSGLQKDESRHRDEVGKASRFRLMSI